MDEVAESAMTTREVAAFLRLSAATVSAMRSNGDGPPFARLGSRTIRYSRRSVEKWLKQRQVS